MTDTPLTQLLATVTDHDVDALLVLADFLEERGDERSAELRRRHAVLYDHWLFAPLAFRHFNLLNDYVLDLFPEYEPRS
jgi:uncharacterized protein (TIGR02996 family)